MSAGSLRPQGGAGPSSDGDIARLAEVARVARELTELLDGMRDARMTGGVLGVSDEFRYLEQAAAAAHDLSVAASWALGAVRRSE